MPYHNPEDIKAKEVMPGFFGKFYHSENTTCAHWQIETDSPLPEHSHHHEQVVNMIEGKFELIVDGESHVLSAGDVFVIPSNVPHSGRSLTDCKIIDVFHPVREDYR
jgi:quercetin dioxygenase-like cupin family protein